MSPFSSRLTSGRYRTQLAAAEEPGHRRPRPRHPAARGLVRESRLRADRQPPRRGGARRLRRQRVGRALHRAQRAVRDDRRGRPLRGPAADDDLPAGPADHAWRLALRLPEQGSRRGRVDGPGGRRRGAPPGGGGLEEDPRRAGRLRERQRGDPLRPRHRAARPDRGPRHRVPPLARAQRLAVLHRRARRRGHRLPGALRPVAHAPCSGPTDRASAADGRARSASSSSAAACPGSGRRACSRRRARRIPPSTGTSTRRIPSRRQGAHRAPRRVRRRGRPGLGDHREALADHDRPRARHRRPLPRLQRGHPQELRLHARAPARAARGHHPHGPDAHGAVRDEPPDDLARQDAHGHWT